MEYEIKIERVIQGRRVKLQFDTKEQNMCVTRETRVASHIEPKKDMIFVADGTSDKRAINLMISRMFCFISQIIDQGRLNIIKL